jgi:hypothetical protein
MIWTTMVPAMPIPTSQSQISTMRHVVHHPGSACK